MRLGLVSTVIISGALSFIGIAIFRQYSIRRKWLDFPNQRSSHDRPVPRGAGIVVVPICLIGYLLMVQVTGTHLSWGYLVGASLLATVSWLDDLYSISFVWRLLTHFICALLVVGFDGGWTVVSSGISLSYPLDWLGPVLTVLWIVWVINAYNFMDGIDGIAAVQGLVASAAWALVAAASSSAMHGFPLLVFGCLTGFIIHNWHPARVFIGDVGSAFLGFTFAAMPVMIAKENAAIANVLPLVSILVLWPFLLDTLLTLARRSLQGEIIWQAHRQHLYQLLVISGLSQPTVAIIYGTFAVFTSGAAIAYINRTVNSRWILGTVFLTSALFTIVVAQIYRRHSRIIGASHEA